MRYTIKTKTEPSRLIHISREQFGILKEFANQRKLADLSVEYQINDCVFTVDGQIDAEDITRISKTLTEEHPTYPTDDFAIMQNVIQNGADKPVEKDYEILQVYVNGDTAPRPYGSIHPDFWPSMVFKIHSVERLSDGKVFKVGDNTKFGRIEHFNESKESSRWVITAYIFGKVNEDNKPFDLLHL